MQGFAGGLIALFGLYGQVDGPIRIPVEHADPYLVVALLTGQQVRMPEIGTAAPWFGPPPQAQGRGVGPEGTYIVNPTDNSILFIPKKG
jgi:hypothetical protein